MEEVSIIGLDIAKNRFQAHGETADGGVVFRKKLARGKVLEFLSKHIMPQRRFDRSRAPSRKFNRVPRAAMSLRSLRRF